MGRMTSHILWKIKCLKPPTRFGKWLLQSSQSDTSHQISQSSVRSSRWDCFPQCLCQSLKRALSQPSSQETLYTLATKSTGTEIAKKRLARHNSALYNLMLHFVCIEFQTYIYMSRDPHTPPHPARWFPPPVAGEGGFSQQPSHGVCSLYSGYNACVSIIRMDILYVI